MTRALIGLAIALTAQGHEIGTTRITAAFSNGAYDVEIVTDAATLAERLARRPIAASDVASALKRCDGTFRERARIAFDGREVRPEIAWSAGQADASIHLTGRIPAGAKRFTWTYGWTFATYSMTIRGGATEWLEGGQTSAPYAVDSAGPATGRLATAWKYLALGYTHIVPHGPDHVLFVLGIYLLSGRLRAVLAQVSAFTVAHSITLGLSLYGVVSAPPRIVEPAIALSIAYVAIENIFLAELKSRRVALVFAFGLLHGMGFAGALRELGLARSEYLTSLVSFNAGVEAGQLSVIAAAFLLVGLPCARRRWYRRAVVVPASALIACMAVYWTVERLI